MARSDEARIDDVRSLLEAARRLVAERARIAPAIADSTGLSAAGVELALTQHLEVDATDDDLRLFVARAGDAERVAVVLSSNVFVGALRAIALARAASEEVRVRPSRRDPEFARALVRSLADPRTTLDEALDVGAVENGEIHVYGRDETIADVRAHARPRVRVRGHGSGMGIAWVGQGASLAAAARALAADVVVFDQRGCLSPRVAFVEGGAARMDAFAEALHAALDESDLTVPRGLVPHEERAAADRYVATMTYACRALVGTDHAVGVAHAGAPLVLPPPYRHVHVAGCASREDAAKLIEPLAGAIIAVGSDDPDAARALAPPWARVSALGRMQKPPLDGAVDLREN
jgi:hypothetical protein